MNLTDRWLVALLAIYFVVLAILPLALQPDATFYWFFSEAGPIETVSEFLWPVAAAIVLVRVRPLGANAWALALLYLVFGAREADLHKAFTGDSLFKTSYYRRFPAPLEEKIIAGLVAIAIIALLLYVLWTMVRFLWADRGWRTRSGAWLLAGMALLVFTKVLDRVPSVLAENYGVQILPIADRYASAFEEGGELAVPLMLAFSAWFSRGERRYL